MTDRVTTERATSEAERLIAFRVRKGGNAKDSARLLDEIAAAHTSYNLATALYYNGFVGQARAERAAEALEIERADQHVREVAALLPFPVELEADMAGSEPGSTGLWIDLGSRDGADDPHDRAGVEVIGARATWWIETAGGETFEDSGLTANSDPVRIAQWIAERAKALGCPAAQIDRPDWATVSRWADNHRAAGAWPATGIQWHAFHAEGDRCTRAETTNDCPRSHDYHRSEAC